MAIQITNNNLRFATHNTYTVSFFGDEILTTVTTLPSVVSQWISDSLRYRRGSLTVGLDVEWRPVTSPNQTHPVAVVQMCIGRRCLVYQIIHSYGDVPQSLADFLSDDDATFVGVGVKEDLDKLRRDYGIGGAARAVDLRSVAAQVYGQAWMRNAGMKELARLVLGREIEKPRWVTTSDWDDRWLSDEQVQYACVDAYVSFEIGRVLQEASYYYYY